ncbi:MAG: hypothetical protein GY729_13745, partial [Desulfobacteraceae bacterium]|nr:hypothetical protein [Desulfobacteraceae bacterium]
AVVFYSYIFKRDDGNRSGRITHTWKKQGQKWKMIGGMSSSGFSWPKFEPGEKHEMGDATVYTSTETSEGKYKIIPIKGNTSYVIEWESGWEADGSETKGPFKYVSSNCSGIMIFINSIGYGKGFCTSVTSEGDTLISEIIQEKMKAGMEINQSRIKFVKGTGKLSGIKGSGQIRTIPIKTGVKGRYKHIAETKLEYKLQ